MSTSLHQTSPSAGTQAEIRITNLKTGGVIKIDRSVTTKHPAWVHEQMGTSSESELQAALDGYNVSDWYRDGKHLGPDDCGLEMYSGATL